MREARLEYLFRRYLNNLADNEEEKEFLELVGDPENKERIQTLLHNYISEANPDSKPSLKAEEAILEAIFQASPPAKIVPMKGIYQRGRWVAAAAIVTIAVTSVLLLVRQSTDKHVAQTVKTIDLPPGRDAAILTLSDGKQIVLDSASGTISNTNGVRVINAKGLLTYQGEGATGEVLYNTISTARGNQYQLVLEDGTRVWLNAASSLRFPVAFNNNFRTVELTGEGYFEVAKDKTKPFHVRIGETDIEVLGTHFNVNSYNDETAIKTTLFEGRVKVALRQPGQKNHRRRQEVVIKPGQQAQTANNSISVKNNVDLEAVISWKNGLFLLDNTDLTAIMRQISRWYDVDIVYSGAIPDRRFEGGISKKLPISGVLEMLEATGIHIRREGKQLIVQP